MRLVSATIAEHWQSFENTLGLRRAPEIQQNEMRVAFYAGASCLLSMVTPLVVNEATRQEACAAFEGWIAELNTFLSLMKCKPKRETNEN
jgi:hypothetical protein